MKIAVLRDTYSPFDEDQYVVDLARKFEEYHDGDLVCRVHPFGPVYLPLQLEIAIRKDGTLAFRSWEFTSTRPNQYLQTHEVPKKYSNPYAVPFTPTEAQIDTVNGLFSGRIRFEGLKIAVGATVQKICPIDVEREQKIIGKKIFLA